MNITRRKYWRIIKIFRSSHWRCSIKIAVLKIFEIFIGKNLVSSHFLIKFFQHRCFLICERPLLNVVFNSCTSSTSRTEVICKNFFLEKFRNICKKTPVLESFLRAAINFINSTGVSY